MFPFRNKNILRFGERKGKRSQEDYEHPLGVLKNAQYQRVRKISKMPCKVLDAPALQDDFYLNLIDWSCNNQLAVGLGNCIYLWNA
jgi:WD40 repeat protein